MALFFRLGRDLMSDIGTLNGVNNFMTKLNQTHLLLIVLTEFQRTGETTQKRFAFHYITVRIYVANG